MFRQRCSIAETSWLEPWNSFQDTSYGHPGAVWRSTFMGRGLFVLLSLEVRESLTDWKVSGSWHALADHALCIQVYPRRCAKSDHIGCGIRGAQCLPVGNGKGNSAETALCSLWHGIKPLQRTGASQAWAASCCRGAEALGVGWASRTQGVHGHVSCFLPIRGQEYVFW